MDPFLDLYEMIGALARRRHQDAERVFSSIGMNHTEARLLTLLHKGGGVATQDTLANQLFVDRSNAGRALKRLEADGYVARSKDDADKRANLVGMTAKGRAAVRAIGRFRKRLAKEFFHALDDKEADRLAALLRKTLGDDGPETPTRRHARGR